MGYLYKLVDKLEMEKARECKLSLSHPIFEFKGSEGKFIHFAHRIYEKYRKNKKGLSIKPSEKDLQEIEEWIEVFKRTSGTDFRDEDIKSESMIIFCGIMQGFCGYYTTKNLEDKSTLQEYLKLNRDGMKNKIGIIKIDTKIFDDHQWHTEDLKEPFKPSKEDSNNLQGFNGFTHPTQIIYNEKYDDYNELLKIYNGDELRHSQNWFNNLSKEFEWQSENRLIFLLNSLEKGSRTLGCKRVYKYNKPITSWAELVYCYIVDAIDYCVNGPSYIYLEVNKNYIDYIPFKDILGDKDNPTEIQ